MTAFYFNFLDDYRSQCPVFHEVDSCIVAVSKVCACVCALAYICVRTRLGSAHVGASEVIPVARGQTLFSFCLASFRLEACGFYRKINFRI